MTKIKIEDTTINLENDKYFINLVKVGILKVYKDGRVFNVKTNRYIGYEANKGYISIGYRVPGTRKVMHMQVHRLIYAVFKYKMKPLPFIVNHKDGVKTNNKISNLESSTYSANSQHAFDTGLNKVSDKTINLLKSLSGEKGRSAKLTNKQANEIRYIHKKYGYSHSKIARMFGISRSGITNIINNKTYVSNRLFYYHPLAVLTRRTRSVRLVRRQKRLVRFRRVA